MNAQPMNVIPGVVQSSPRGERFWDIYSLLLKERIIMLFTPISGAHDPPQPALFGLC